MCLGGRELCVMTFDKGECWLPSFLSHISTLFTRFSTISSRFSSQLSRLHSLSRRVCANNMGLVVIVWRGQLFKRVRGWARVWGVSCPSTELVCVFLGRWASALRDYVRYGGLLASHFSLISQRFSLPSPLFCLFYPLHSRFSFLFQGG